MHHTSRQKGTRRAVVPGRNMVALNLGLLALATLSVVLMSAGWRTDFDRAKQDAKEKHKLILLKFTGSDWCLPCIKMEENVFSKQRFSQFAATNLELVSADFPRKKKNKPASALQSQNDALAEEYDKEGHFPYTLLLDANGKVLKIWDGYNGEKPETLVQQISSYVGSN